MSDKKHSLQSGIRDNHFRGKLGDYLKSQIKPGSQLFVVSANFTIYAYQALKDNLDAIGNMRFLFGDPSFLEILHEEFMVPNVAPCYANNQEKGTP